MKTCVTCKVPKPLDADHFYRQKKSEDGFEDQCKVCRNKGRDPAHRCKGQGSKYPGGKWEGKCHKAASQFLSGGR